MACMITNSHNIKYKHDKGGVINHHLSNMINTGEGYIVGWSNPSIENEELNQIRALFGFESITVGGKSTCNTYKHPDISYTPEPTKPIESIFTIKDYTTKTKSKETFLDKIKNFFNGEK